jgi:hypothetical protein
MSAIDFLNRILKNNRVRLLKEDTDKPIRSAIYNDDVRKAFNDFVRLAKGKNYSIIGGIAIGKYTAPRNTMDIDVIVKNDGDISKIEEEVKSKFKRTRSHAFEHKSTGVEVEVLTPEFLCVNGKMINDAINKSIDDDGAMVVSPKYLIALKLCRAVSKNRKSLQDKYDITNIIDGYKNIDMSDVDLTKEEIDLYNELLKEYGSK